MMTPIQIYNHGVVLYREHRFQEAIVAFGDCFQTGEYQFQSAYARILCQRELGLKTELPAGMGDLGEQLKTVFVASNLVGYLLEQGHQAVICKLDSTCQLEAEVNNTIYVINIASLMGSFKNQAWRREGSKTISLDNSIANPEPTPTDIYIMKLVNKAAQLPLAILPEKGLEGTLK